MSPPHHSRRSAIIAVIVIAVTVIVPALGAPVVHTGTNTTLENDTSVHGDDSADCWVPIQSAVRKEGKTEDVLLDKVVHNTSEQEGKNTTRQFLPPCHILTSSANETEERTLIVVEQIGNATIGTLNRTTRGATTAVDTVTHSVVGVVNGTVSAVRSTPGTEIPVVTTPPESDDEQQNSKAGKERTESPPTERTTHTEDDASPPTTSTSTPTVSTTAATTTATRQPTTATQQPTTTATRQSTTAQPSSPQTTTSNPRPDQKTETAVFSHISVQPPSNQSNEGASPPGGKRLPFEPEPKTGAAVGLGATAVRVFLKHGGTASETMLRPGNVWMVVRTRLTAVIGSLSRGMVLLRYSRYDDSDPLEHDGRAIVFETIEETPGIYLSAISDHTEFALSTLRHHLRVLEQEELLISVKVHGKRRFYPADTERIELTAALGEEATANVIEALCRLGPATVSELADELDRDPSTVTHHLQRLDDDDIVCRRRSGRVVMNRLTDNVVTYLTEQPERGPAVSSAD